MTDLVSSNEKRPDSIPKNTETVRQKGPDSILIYERQIWAVSFILSPQDGVRIIFNHPEYLIYFRVHNFPGGFVQIDSLVFEWATKM